jgi:hypothetical protein
MGMRILTVLQVLIGVAILGNYLWWFLSKKNVKLTSHLWLASSKRAQSICERIMRSRDRT